MAKITRGAGTAGIKSGDVKKIKNTVVNVWDLMNLIGFLKI